MKNLIFTFIIIFISVGIYAQSTSNTIFTKGDKINLVMDAESDYHYVHLLQKGQSLYALSKTFNIPLGSIYRINNLDEESTLSIDQKIKIPIKNENLYKGKSLEGLKFGHYIPVYYKTKPKDNLFRISRIYFSQPTEDLIFRNNLTGNNLSLGQDILIGWLPIDRKQPGVSNDEFVEELESSPLYPNPSDISNSDVDKATTADLSTSHEESDTSVSNTDLPEGFNLSLLGTLTYSKSMKEIKKSEVAHWDKSMPDNGMVYVLHNKAIIDSYIEMYNPILKRSVRAKVIGRIPYGAYAKNVCLVLSPRAAIQLGALDNRFKVEVKALFNEIE